MFSAVSRAVAVAAVVPLCIASPTLARAASIGAPPSLPNPQFVTAVGDSLYFVADDPVLGTELFVSDGTASGTHVVEDLDPGKGGTQFFGIIPFGTRAFFFATDSITRAVTPFISDGTEAGTFPLLTTQATAASPHAILGERIFFVTQLGDDYHLVVSDGTLAGTQAVDLPGIALDSSSVQLAALDDAVLFTAFDPNHGVELFRTDGTTAGTHLVLDILPGSEGSAPFELVRVGERVCFTAFLPNLGHEVWASDGTAAGTQLLVDSVPGPAGGYTSPPVDFLGRTLFLTHHDSTGTELWNSDGTPAGTSRIATFPSGFVTMTPLLAGEHGVVFGIGTQIDNATPWRTDGTLPGTLQIPSPGPLAIPSLGFATVFDTVGTDREIVLTIRDPVAGTELFHCDGSPNPVLPLGDLAPGPLSAFPRAVERLADRVFITEGQGVNDVELLTLPLTSFDSYVEESFGFGCAPIPDLPPTLEVTGEPVVNASFTLSVHGMPSSSIALLVIGNGLADSSFSPLCALHVAPPFVMLASAVDAQGALAIPGALGVEWLGTRIVLQALASANPGLYATPGLELVVGS